MKRSRWGITRKSLLVAIPTLMVGALIWSGFGSASPTLDGDHWVDNLGSGVTAEGFSEGNSSSDCENDAFLAGDYDLWHFVVNQATDETGAYLEWNSDLSEWFNPSTVEAWDVSSDYGPYLSGDSTKHLWFATTPPGATLIAGRLEYPGEAGGELLSHTCARSLVDDPIYVDLTSQGSYDLEYGWEIDKQVDSSPSSGGYLLDYSVGATRNAVPSLIDGSLKVVGNFTLDPPDAEFDSVSVIYAQDAILTTCDVDTIEFTYECDLSAAGLPIDSATGRPTGVGNVNIEVEYEFGVADASAEVDWSEVEPFVIYAEFGSTIDDYATPGDSADDLSTESDLLEYQVTWTPTGVECVERTNEARLDLSPSYEGMDEPSDSVTVRWCPAVPSLTIGYWGNKFGAPIVLSNLASLKSQYPNVLGWLPNFTTTTQVRNFFVNANCSGDCKSMFAAQFLSVAMNARDEAFRNQSIVYGFTCKTVGELLNLGETTVFGGTTAERIALKNVYDDLNNSRAATCLTVIY